jgi:subtilisin family serine protease
MAAKKLKRTVKAKSVSKQAKFGGQFKLPGPVVSGRESSVSHRRRGRAKAKELPLPVPQVDLDPTKHFLFTGVKGSKEFASLEDLRVPKSYMTSLTKRLQEALAEQEAKVRSAAETAAAAVVAAAPRLPVTSATLAINAIGTRLSPVKVTTLGELGSMKMDVNPNMDPRLQLAVVNRRTGRVALPTSSTTSDEVAVVARVKSVEAWENLPDVYAGVVLGKADDGFIVTGRIPSDRCAAVRLSPDVLSLKASQPVHANLGKTVETMAVSDKLLPAGVKPNGGKGVIVGIVDIGGDFAHPNFQDSDGGTRLLALWHQAGPTRAGDNVKYGRVYRPDEINQAIKASDPYGALGYGPAPDRFEQGTHGTHVMDIAAGNGNGTQLPGVAPKADLIFVDASLSDVHWEGVGMVDNGFGDSVMLLEAIQYIFEEAGDRPCVVNISLGTNGGPHDGTSLVEKGIDTLLRAKPNRSIVIAAGNAQLDGVHASGAVGPGATADLVWNVKEIVGGECEVWYEPTGALEVTLLGPDGTVFGPVPAGGNQTWGTEDTQVAIFIASRLDDPNNHQHHIDLWIAPGVMEGEWTVRLRSLGGPNPINYHAWIERNDNGQGSFKLPTPSHVLGSISTGFESVVVGSYDAHKAGFPISNFSSAGPTRDGRQKPEISGPGHQVLAAWSRKKDAVTRKSGTSMAAPAITGLIALILAEAKRKNQTLTIQQLRAKLLAGLDGPPPAAGGAWDPCYGTGRGCSKSI